MNEERRTAPRAENSAPAFTIEAHYYEGGLRVTPVAVATRPAWVPPSDLVGFRGEFPLGPGEPVVEFARFAFAGRRVTWIGVFHRSVDQVFGDRHNNAGIGVWIADGTAIAPLLLLDGLRQLSDALARGEVEGALANARQFAGQAYLPSYLASAVSLPAGLGGWAYSANAMPETALLVARARDPDGAWSLAAEQVLRMSVLPDTEGKRSRALMLVTAGALEGDRAAMLAPVRNGLAAELLARLPEATAALGEESRQLRGEVEQLAPRLAQAEATLAEAQSARAELERRLAEMDAQLDGDELLRKLPLIEKKLERIDSEVSGVASAVMRFHAEWGNWRAVTQNQQGAVGRLHAQRTVHLENRPSSDRGSGGDGEGWDLVPLLCWAAAAVALLLFGWFIWSQVLKTDPPPPAIVYEAPEKTEAVSPGPDVGLDPDMVPTANNTEAVGNAGGFEPPSQQPAIEP